MNEMRRAVYLLKIWREGDDEPLRITLEDPHTRERKAFPTLAAMTDFLTEQGLAVLEQLGQSGV